MFDGDQEYTTYDVSKKYLSLEITIQDMCLLPKYNTIVNMWIVESIDSMFTINSILRISAVSSTETLHYSPEYHIILICSECDILRLRLKHSSNWNTSRGKYYKYKI